MMPPIEESRKADILARLNHLRQIGRSKRKRLDTNCLIVSIRCEEGQRGLARMLSDQELDDLRESKQIIAKYFETLINENLPPYAPALQVLFNLSQTETMESLSNARFNDSPRSYCVNGHLLDEAPVSIVVMAIEEVARLEHRPPAEIWLNVAKLAKKHSDDRQEIWI
jgi:hypothetical protein